MIHRPFLRSAIQVVGDFRIGDFDLQSYQHPLTRCRFMIPYIVEDVMLSSRSPHVAKCVKVWAECRHKQWSYVIVEYNEKENNMRECLNLGKKV